MGIVRTYKSKHCHTPVLRLRLLVKLELILSTTSSKSEGIEESKRCRDSYLTFRVKGRNRNWGGCGLICFVKYFKHLLEIEVHRSYFFLSHEQMGRAHGAAERREGSAAGDHTG